MKGFLACSPIPLLQKRRMRRCQVSSLAKQRGKRNSVVNMTDFQSLVAGNCMLNYVVFALVIDICILTKLL